MRARTLIDKLDLKPHPEGGSYGEIYRSSERVQTARGTRSAITAIYYILERRAFARCVQPTWRKRDGRFAPGRVSISVALLRRNLRRADR
jgi:predicted cupin superfamily sugar epimerase